MNNFSKAFKCLEYYSILFITFYILISKRRPLGFKILFSLIIVLLFFYIISVIVPYILLFQINSLVGKT